VAHLPFGFHVQSMPGAGEKSGCQEPRDDASVLDGEAERSILLGVSGVASSAFAKRASVSLDAPRRNQRPPAPHRALTIELDDSEQRFLTA
jgi:hypothetical protein